MQVSALVLHYHLRYSKGNCLWKIKILLHKILSLPLEVCKDSFSLGHRLHISSHEIPIQSMDSYCSMTSIFQSSIFVNFVRGCYCERVTTEMKSHSHCGGSLVHAYVCDLFSYLHLYCRITRSKGNNWNSTESQYCRLIMLVLLRYTYLA